MKLDPKDFELHNLILKDGRLQVRNGLISIKTPTAGTSFVAGFTVESPFTTEAFHYLVEQTTTTLAAVLRVFTEEFTELFSVDLGILPKAPIFTYGVQLNQIMINSESLSAPLYGIVGGGLISAVKTTSTNIDTTTLDVPTGLTAAFGDRLPVATGNIVYFNDASIDPRTYVAQNALSLPGTITDMFTGPEGSLYMFTTRDTHVLAQDALGVGQEVKGFIATITGLSPSKTRNAAGSNGVVACLSRDHLVMVSNGQQRIDLAPYKGKRFYSLPIEIDDLRTSGQLFPTSNGFILSFGTSRPFFLTIDLRSNFRSYTWSKAGTAFNVVGVLKSRDGDDLILMKDRVCQSLGNTDYDSSAVRGVACGRIDVPADSSGLVRSMTVASDNIGQATLTYVASKARTGTAPSKVRDTVVGTGVWSASAKLNGRESRTTRHQMAVRCTDLQVELAIEGAQRILESCDLEFGGQGRNRRDRR